MLDVFDCTQHMADGGVKDAPYIARLFIPLIKKLEDMTDPFVSADIIVSIIFAVIFQVTLF
jgi:hypothetical protein